MKRTAIILAAAMALVCALSGCAGKPPMTTGAYDGNTYTNDFFGLTYSVPDGWVIASREDLIAIFEASTEAVGSDDKEAEKSMKLGEQEIVYLGYVAPHEYDYMEGSNPNLNLLCENLQAAGLVIRDSAAYVEAALDDLRSQYDSMGVAYSIADPTTETIGGAEFSVIDATLTGDGYEVYQRMLCTVKNNYALVFTLTWYDDAELPDLETIVDSIQIK